MLADRHIVFRFGFVVLSNWGCCSDLLCCDPTLTVSKRTRAVSTDWYRYHFVVTALTGPGCKHRPVPVCAYSPDGRDAA